MGFLSSLRKGYEEAVQSSTENEEKESMATETLEQQTDESSQAFQQPAPVPQAPVQEPPVPAPRRMLISDHSLPCNKTATSSSRAVDKSNNWQQLQTPAQSDASNTQLSYLPMQMNNGMRQMWPAPVTDGSSSKATNDTNSSGESEECSDKGNPSSSEESDREPQQYDRSLGPPRKRHKTKHAYGAFTRRNVKLHDSISAAAAQLEEDCNDQMMASSSSLETPNGLVRDGPRKPPRM
jgi:hypothetical protein